MKDSAPRSIAPDSQVSSVASSEMAMATHQDGIGTHSGYTRPVGRPRKEGAIGGRPCGGK